MIILIIQSKSKCSSVLLTVHFHFTFDEVSRIKYHTFFHRSVPITFYAIRMTTNWSIFEKSTSLEVLSPTVEDEIDSFVTSVVGNNYNDRWETLDLFDSAYKNNKYKKTKDFLLRD